MEGLMIIEISLIWEKMRLREDMIKSGEIKIKTKI
jgi:hypothetical protein